MGGRVMIKDRLPRVDELVIEELSRAFSTDSILQRLDLNAEQKIAYLMATREIINYLETCRDENSN